jgi:hypothetical protein
MQSERHSAISTPLLQLAVQAFIGAKGDNNDWIGTPDDAAKFIETVARKLVDLSEAR